MQHQTVQKRNAFSGRRILSLLLAFMLVFAIGGVPALADETGDGGAEATATPEPMSAAVPPRPENLYVYDAAEVLSDETESSVVNACKALNESCGAEIAVMTMSQMPGSSENADARKAYAAQVVETWNLGGDTGNGLLLVLSIDDSDYWIAPTEKFQENFTMSVLRSLMSDYLETDFANKDYDAAVTKFVTAAAERAEAFVQAQQLAAGNTASASPSPEASAADGAGGNTFLSVLSGIGIVLLVLIGIVVVLCIVAYVHGRYVRKKRMEARRRRRSTARSTAQRRSGTTRSRTSGTARAGRVDDYTDFMNRYK